MRRVRWWWAALGLLALVGWPGVVRASPTVVTPTLTPATQTVGRGTVVVVTVVVTPASVTGMGFRGTVQWSLNGRSFASTSVVYDQTTDTATATLPFRAPSVPGQYRVAATLISGDVRFVPASFPANPATGVLIVTP